MAGINSNLPSLINVENVAAGRFATDTQGWPVVMSQPAYVNGRLYHRGDVVGFYDSAGDQLFTPAGPVVSAREMRVLLGTVIHDPRHVVRMQAEADAARRRAEARSDFSAIIASHNALMEEIARPVRPFRWPSWLVWLFTRPAPLPVLAPRRTSVITRHGFGGAGARA